jgi:hypothetical protein
MAPHRAEVFASFFTKKHFLFFLKKNHNRSKQKRRPNCPIAPGSRTAS